MQIYFSPEYFNEQSHVLNIVTDRNKPVGYLAFLLDETSNKMYVYGHLEEEGVSEDFKDLVKPYLQGLKKIKAEIEVYSYLSLGGKQVTIELDE
ncbi:hypothetical protein [Halalkalibacter sp. APA_J-10(15)]|uniref:hypothetical protein n=1 Tax=unclassified Halalkalibacter TaxID=2893063 RepID=UPI001FF27C1E|nr:hypothetical protein [Halalkalibacter sp. APA_J-10(15)]MCK0473111.1 hypothetical protein [Halalkalibacter sp. APA_J-10(15)]